MKTKLNKKTQCKSKPLNHNLKKDTFSRVNSGCKLPMTIKRDSQDFYVERYRTLVSEIKNLGNANYLRERMQINENTSL